MEHGIIRSMLRSLLAAYVLSGLLLAALAFGLWRLRLPEIQVNVLIFVIYFITCLTGGFLAGKRLKQRRFFWGLLFGLFYFLVLFGASCLLTPGAALNMERSVWVLGVCALGGMVGGMLS